MQEQKNSSCPEAGSGQISENGLSYRPAAFYSRDIARHGRDKAVRLELLRLTREYELLRQWVRQQGMIPPRLSLLENQLRDIQENPVTEFQHYLSQRTRGIRPESHE